MPNIEEKLNTILQNQLGFFDEVNEKLNTVTKAYPYQVKHEPEIRLTIEQEYEEIVENYPDVIGLSYVGIRTFLKPNDTIDMQTGRGTYGRIFINRRELSTSYTYTGENMEIATVFYFSNADGTLDLTNITIDADEVVIVDLNGGVTVPVSITNYARVVYVDSTRCPFPTNCKLLKVNKWRTIPNSYIYPVELTMNNNPMSSGIIATGKTPRLIIQSETICMQSGNSPLFSFVSSAQTEVITPNLIDISGTTFVFVSVYKYTFPDTINNIGQKSFSGVLNCLNISNANSATFDDNWYGGNAPTELVCTATDWTADINLAVAGAKQGVDWFVDFFGRLHDYSGTNSDGRVHSLTIPADVLDSLTEEQESIASNKNWTLSRP